MRFHIGLAKATGALAAIKLIHDLSYQRSYCSEHQSMSEQLAGVIIITRHGARTPLSLINGIEQAEYTQQMLEPMVHAKYKLVNLDGSDFIDSISKSDKRGLEFKLKGGAGKGQLTTYGEKQLFELGKLFRQRYIQDLKFLSPDYNQNEIYIRSTHLNRTIHSAKSFLAGLYLKNCLVNTNEPFVINVNDGNIDYLFPNIFNCSYLDEFYKATSEKHELLEKAEYVKFVDSLGEEIGTKVSTSPFAIIAFLDDLRAREAHNKYVPPNLLKLIDQLHHFSTLEMKRDMNPKLQLFFGKFLNLMKTNLLDMSTDEKKSRPQKLYYYSAHDTTLNGILLALDLIDENHSWPPFAAHLVFELWKDTDKSDYFIKVFYCGKLLNISKMNTDNSTRCSLSEFVEKIDTHIIDDSMYVEMCQRPVE